MITEESARDILLIGLLMWLLLGLIAGIIVAFTEETVTSFSVACFWIGLCMLMGPISFLNVCCYYLAKWLEYFKS